MNIEAIKNSIETLNSLSANQDPKTNETLNLAFRLNDIDAKKNIMATVGILESLLDRYLDSIKNTPMNAGKKWEEEEDNSLIRQFDYSTNKLGENLELTIEKLSEFHKRSERAIAYRLKLLEEIVEVPNKYTINSYNRENTENTENRFSEVSKNQTESSIKDKKNDRKREDNPLDAIIINESDFQTHIRSLLADLHSNIDEGPGQYYEMSPNNWHKLHGHFFDKDKIRSARKELQYSITAWLDSNKSVDQKKENFIIDDLKIEIYGNDLALVQVAEISLLATNSEISLKLRECHSQF